VVAVGDNSDDQCDVTGWDLDLLPPLGPVAYYPFNGNANDESGNGNNGSIYGNLKVVSGVNGNAYRFDGNSDYIQVENFKGLDRQEMTIALWVKPDVDASPSMPHNLISKHGDLTNIEMLILQEKDLKYDIEWTIGNVYYDLTSRMSNSANPDDIGWILPDYSVFDFIASVYDGLSIRLYVNSDLIALYKASGVIADNELPLIIGGRSSDPTVENFKGIIDEVRIYNRALDASEIWQLYNDACQVNADCDNGAFCDGAEKCQNGSCVKGQSPCTQRQTCDETANRCLDCIGDAQCDDGVFCNGREKCVNGICGDGTNPCAADQTCDETANRCLDCIGDAQCDDGIFCNGSEKCNNGTCVTYPSCAEAQLCKEEQDECWEVKTITATCLQRSINCPILQEQKRTWIIMYSFAEHHCDPGTSRLEVSGAGTDFHGIQIDARRPFKIFGFIFIPLNIDRDASVGQWNIQITTDLDSTKTEERIVAWFKIR
jgi:hypothetical protein